MSTLKPKAKSKKPGKSSRSDSRNLDLSELRKPVEISVSSLKEAAKLLETGTPEVKDLLTYEVNLIYECRICRSIYRSLVNLISHKRAFCREKVNVSSENKSRDDNAKSTNITREDLECSELNQIALDLLMNPSKNDRILRSQAPGKANKKDLTSVLDMLQKKQVENLGEPTNQKDATDCDQVVLQVMDSKLAAFQTLIDPNSPQDDLMENQVMELENMLNQDTVVLGTDGQIEKSDSPVHFYSNEETKKFICTICSYTFATQKTLNSHVKIKHAGIRDCYFCPCNPCTSSFTSYTSVKRHLTNVHRKIGPELKSLSQHVEKRTLRTKPTSVLVNKKPKKPENTGNIIDESQEWIEFSDRQVEINDCISCGEKFNEKSEHISHTETCIVQNNERIPDRIVAHKESSLDDDIICDDDPEVEKNLLGNSTPGAREIVSLISSENNQESSPIDETSTISFEKEGINDLAIRVQEVSSLSEEDWRKLPDWSSENEETASKVKQTEVMLSQEVVLTIKKPNRPTITESKILQVPQIVFTRVDNSKKRKFSSLSEFNEPVREEKWKKLSSQRDEIEKVESDTVRSQLLSETIASLSDHTKLKCNICKRNFSNITSLNRHMENHIKINRYRCKKCDFKSVNRNDCVGHCNKMHNAMNNRQVLNEMITQISQDQFTLSQELITVDPSNLNAYEMQRAFSNVDSRIGNMNLVTNVLQKNHNTQPLTNSPRNYKDSNISRIISDSVNPSDTDTETEETVYRRIDSNPNLQEMIREVVIGKNFNGTLPITNSNSNRVSQSLSQNNNLERAKVTQLDGYSLPIGEINFQTDYLDEEDEISSEFYPKSKKRSNSRVSNRSNSRASNRSNSRASNRSNSRASNRSNSRASNRSNSRSSNRSNSRSGKRDESRMQTRSSSRLGKKLNSDDEDEDEISTCLSKRSSSRTETRSEPRMMTRSQSRLENKIDSYLEEDENSEDYWQNCSRDLNSEEKIPRPKSQIRKSTKETRGQSVSRQDRGKSRGRRSAPATNNIISPGREERRESFSSENSLVQRPIRNRVKHIDKDFIYDLENVTFKKESSYSPSNSSGKKSNGNRFAQVNRFSSNVTKRLFNNETEDIDFIKELPKSNSGSDLENSELYFLGFPRQPEIFNVE